ncbi:MAG: hypothetical protein IJZ16_01765 [Clostridia bacterium]|nr:hypothetical protein [Clostridia bacterium]
MKRILTLLLIVSIILTGCSSENAPELLAPIKTIDATYTVTKGTISNNIVLDGYVIPSTETVYFETEGMAYDIKYRPGDIVKSGDVIISLNEGIDEDIEALSSELTQFLTISEYYVSQHTEEIESMNSILATKSGMDHDLYEIEIKSKQTEYNRFNQQRADEYETMLTNYNELLSKQEHSIISAPCDGTIVYVGVLRDGDYASKNSVALVIADETSKMVRFDYIDNEILSSLDEFYIQIGSEKYDDITMIEYTQEEIDYYSQYGYEICSRAVINGLPEDVESGSYCGIFMTYDKVENTIYVPNESIFYDAPNSTDYCLVYNEDGTQERYPVTLGTETTYYTEITEGLSEGQVIFYAEDQAAWAEGIGTTEVFLGDYSNTTTFNSAYKTSMNSQKFIVEIPGTVSEVFINVTSNVEVEEGTPLFSLIPHVEQSVYEQAKIDYDNAVESYDSSIAGYDEMISAKLEALNNAVGEIDIAIAQYEYDTLVEQKTDFVESLDENIAKLEADLAVYEACMQGEEVIISAPCSGTLFIDITLTNAEIGKNQVIGRIDDTESYVCYINEGDNEGLLQYGNKVTILSDGGAVTTTGVVYGNPQLVEKGFDGTASVRLDNEADSIKVHPLTATASVKDIEISDVTLIDAEYVHYDEEGMSYVLLKQGEFYVKRYITIARVSSVVPFVWVKDGLNVGDICVKI